MKRPRKYPCSLLFACWIKKSELFRYHSVYFISSNLDYNLVQSPRLLLCAAEEENQCQYCTGFMKSEVNTGPCYAKISVEY